MTSVVVAICTFQRPESLRRLVSSIADCDREGLSVDVVIVDNDAERSAEAIVEAASIEGLRVQYVSEPVRGISGARNRLVAEALRFGSDYVVFVDDDEWVDRQWLHVAVKTATRTSAASVAGPVIPSYAGGTPSWVRNGGFFERPRFRTGDTVRIENIGNVLVSTDRIGELMPSPFGTGFVAPGGEDTFFLRQMYAHGCTTVWCDEAVVHELVPADRARARWLLRRAFRGGANHTRCLWLLDLGRRTLILRAAACTVRIAQGIATIPIAALRGRHHLIAAAMITAGGVGGLLELPRRA